MSYVFVVTVSVPSFTITGFVFAYFFRVLVTCSVLIQNAVR